MPEYLNIWVAGAILVSIPLVTDKQKEAGAKVFQGERDASVFMVIESTPRVHTKRSD